MASTPHAHAVVLGDYDLIRPLGRAGIPVVAALGPGRSEGHSRWVVKVLERTPHLPDELVGWAERQPAAPVLYTDDDEGLLLFSRHRDRLGPCCRFLLPEAEIVEQLIDKRRFIELAEPKQLPVPRTEFIPLDDPRLPRSFAFPVLVKPLRRHKPWQAAMGNAKATQVNSSEELQELCGRLAEALAGDSWERPTHEIEEEGLAGVLVQDLVIGPESAIESYHAYHDAQGQVVAEFTGRKIRTRPTYYGLSSALRLTDVADVRDLGRSIVEQLGLVGVTKLDFKRDPTGRLWLLEVNPRFTLWHDLAASAGLNVPLLYHADLAGEPRPAPSRVYRHNGRQVLSVHPGATWTRVSDFKAAREAGIPARRWLRFALGADTFQFLGLDDPTFPPHVLLQKLR
jgi:predicted ATP-grasp superfamily ATP-dependent carboligase